jgi:hypothetical protein
MTVISSFMNTMAKSKHADKYKGHWCILLVFLICKARKLAAHGKPFSLNMGAL